jgi:hypothetical protein
MNVEKNATRFNALRPPSVRSLNDFHRGPLDKSSNFCILKARVTMFFQRFFALIKNGRGNRPDDTVATGFAASQNVRC